MKDEKTKLTVKKKKGGLFWGELLLIIGFGALSSSLKIHSVAQIIFSLCIVLLGVAVFLILEMRTEYTERQTLFKSISIISFLAANAFFCFSFCFDSKLHQYDLLYGAVTAVLLLPYMIISKSEKRK